MFNYSSVVAGGFVPPVVEFPSPAEPSPGFVGFPSPPVTLFPVDGGGVTSFVIVFVSGLLFSTGFV